MLGLLSEKKVSPDDSQWTTEIEIEYWPYNHLYGTRPRYEYSFGLLQKEYSEYHTTGELKKVEYPGTSNYELFENYYRGVPEKITVPKRYATGIDVMTREVDNEGRITKETDFNGNVVRYNYDGIGRLERINYEDVKWNDISYFYDDINHTITKYFDGYQEISSLDALGRITEIEKQEYEETLDDYAPISFEFNTFDLYGNLKTKYFAASTPYGNQYISYSYDVLDRKIGENNFVTGNSRDWFYLYGNKIAEEDSLGNGRTTTFLSYGRQSYQIPAKIQEPASVATEINYNEFLNPESVTQSGVTETYVYDDHQRLCLFDRPDTGTTTYGYNQQGNVIWEERGSSASNTSCDSNPSTNKISYEYDNRNDLHKKTTTTSTLMTQTLDAVGNVDRMEATGSVWDYEYNDRNLLEKETLTVDGRSFVLDWDYNDNGYVSSLTYPDGRVVSFLPNVLGQPTQAGSYASDAAYHPSGLLESFTYGNGIERTVSANGMGMIESITDSKNGANLFKHGYEYDTEHNLINLTDYVEPQYDLVSLNYDGLNRLRTGSGYWGTIDIYYDNKNNITSMTLGSQSATYHYDTNNRLDSITGSESRSFAYDNQGNVTHNGKRGFNYDEANQMTDSGGMTFLYDGFGKRVKKQGGSGVNYYVYSRKGKLMYTESNVWETNYIRLGKHLVAKDKDYTPIIKAMPAIMSLLLNPTSSNFKQ